MSRGRRTLYISALLTAGGALSHDDALRDAGRDSLEAELFAGSIVYTVAAGVAISRVNDRQHFPSDVVAGALIGRAVAKGVAARHARGKMAWVVTPAIISGRPALPVRLRQR